MAPTVITPSWATYRTASPFVDPKLTGVEQEGGGFTIGKLWEETANYLEYLANRADAPNSPEVYRLLAENGGDWQNGSL